MMGSNWNHMMTGPSDWGWVGMTLMIVFWVAVLALALYLVARLLVSPGGRAPENKGDRAEAILRARFARGEISEDQYRDAQQTLSGAPRG